MSNLLRGTIVSVALGILMVDGLHAVEQDKAKCAEGIGCYDRPDKKPPAPQRSRQAPNDPSNKSTGPGLGKGIMQLPPGEFGARGRTPGDLASANDECRNRQDAQADRNVGGTHYRSHPELNASQCIRLGTKTGVYGPGFANTCGYRVLFTFCAFRPKKDSWAEAFDCEKTKGGTELMEPRSEIAAHTKDADYFYWAACKFPEGLPSDIKFTAAQGHEFRCMAWSNERTIAALSNHRGTACETADVARNVADKLEADRIAAEAERQKREREAAEALARAARERSAALKPPPVVSAAPRGQVPSSGAVNGDPIAQCQGEWNALVSNFRELQRFGSFPAEESANSRAAARLGSVAQSRGLVCSAASLASVDRSLAYVEGLLEPTRRQRDTQLKTAVNFGSKAFDMLAAESGLLMIQLEICDQRALRRDYLARCGGK